MKCQILWSATSSSQRQGNFKLQPHPPGGDHPYRSQLWTRREGKKADRRAQQLNSTPSDSNSPIGATATASNGLCVDCAYWLRHTRFHARVKMGAQTHRRERSGWSIQHHEGFISSFPIANFLTLTLRAWSSHKIPQILPLFSFQFGKRFDCLSNHQLQLSLQKHDNFCGVRSKIPFIPRLFPSNGRRATAPLIWSATEPAPLVLASFEKCRACWANPLSTLRLPTLRPAFVRRQ